MCLYRVYISSLWFQSSPVHLIQLHIPDDWKTDLKRGDILASVLSFYYSYTSQLLHFDKGFASVSISETRESLATNVFNLQHVPSQGFNFW